MHQSTVKCEQTAVKRNFSYPFENNFSPRSNIYLTELFDKKYQKNEKSCPLISNFSFFRPQIIKKNLPPLPGGEG